MELFQRVKMTTDKYEKKGVKKGDVGYILEVYDSNNFEVEFSDINGNTVLLCSFPRKELELVE